MKLFFVDSFTDEPFKGNPACVCLLENEIDKAKMQNIANEIGFSETAYIKKIDEAGRYSIRYFSPKKEIPLCGHATLASAKIIFQNSNLTDIFFITGENVELTIIKKNDKIVMGFPIYDTTDITVPNSMLEALGIKTFKNTSYSVKNKIIIIEIEDSNTLAELNPNFISLVNSYSNINGVLVTAISKTKEFDFHYRYFWPWAGTNEDPVTGGVQTFLTKYWSKILKKTTLKAFQSSKRTGIMTTELQNERVFIYGDAVIVLEGELKI